MEVGRREARMIDRWLVANKQRVTNMFLQQRYDHAADVLHDVAAKTNLPYKVVLLYLLRKENPVAADKLVAIMTVTGGFK